MCLLFWKNVTSPQQYFSKTEVQIQTYYTPPHPGTPLATPVGCRQSELRRSSQSVEDSSSCTWHSLASPPPIQLFLRSYWFLQYNIAAFHLPLEISKTTPQFKFCYLNLRNPAKALWGPCFISSNSNLSPKTEAKILLLCLNIFCGYLCGSAGKESVCNAGDLGWEDPWRRERLPTPGFWPGESHGLHSPSFTSLMSVQ